MKRGGKSEETLFKRARENATLSGAARDSNEKGRGERRSVNTTAVVDDATATAEQ